MFPPPVPAEVSGVVGDLNSASTLASKLSAIEDRGVPEAYCSSQYASPLSSGFLLNFD